MVEIQIKKLHPDAIIPEYAHPTDAGMDLFAYTSAIIAPKTRASISTGFSMAFPPGYVALFWDKSGLAAKSGLTILAGVIDSEYRGEPVIVVFNTSDQPYEVKKGQKIAQMLIQPVVHATVSEVTELNNTVRGTGGLGSTGIEKNKN